MSALGRLVASIALDSGEFTKGADKAQYRAAALANNVDNAMRGMESRVMSTMKSIAGLLAAGYSVTVLNQWIKETIKANAALDDLSEKTGTSVETLSGMVEVAKIGGHEIGLLEASMTKLSRGSENSNNALAALGLSSKDANGKLKDSGTLTQEIAIALGKYADGTGKAAIAQDLFGKSGALLLPYLKDLASAGQLATKVTTEQAAAAEHYEKTLNKLAIAKGDMVRTVVTAVLPSLQAAADMYLKNKTASDALLASTQKLAADGSVSSWADSLANGLGIAYETVMVVGGNIGFVLKGIVTELYGIGRQVKALAAGDWNTFVQIGDEMKTSAALARTTFDAWEASVMKTREAFKEQLKLNQLIGEANRGAFSDQNDRRAKRSLEYSATDEAARLAAGKAAQKELERMRDIDARGWAEYYKFKEDAYEADGQAALRERNKTIAEEKRLLAMHATGELAYYEWKEDQYIANGQAALAERNKTLAAEKKLLEEATGNYIAVWDNISTAAGSFFSDLVMNGKSAFDKLKQSLKSLAADLLAFFAKRWVLNMVAGAGMGGMSAAASAASSAMGNTLTGTAVAAGSSYLFGTAGAYQATGMAMAEYAGIASQTTGLVGAGGFGSTISSAFAAMGPVGWAALAAAAVYAIFRNKDGNAERTGYFGDPGAQDANATRWNSALGTSAFFNTRWFGDDQKPAINQFMSGLTNLDNAFASRMNPADLARTQAMLSGRSAQYGFGLEHGPEGSTFGDILKDRVHEIFGIVAPELQKLVDGFAGTGEALGTFALDLLDVRAALEKTKVPDLTIDSLMKMQAAGESLGQTFMRVAGDFLNARAALDQAIGARNPRFARESTLSARNDIAQAFADAVGLNFGEELLARMALNPETFAGLTTSSMNLLTQFLGLQTTLEGLDTQLNTLTVSVVDAQTVWQGQQDQYWDTIRRGLEAQARIADARVDLAAYLRGTSLSDLSPLSPMAQYAESRSQYNRLLGLSQGGDLDAINGLGSARDTFLQFSRMINASSGQYNTDFFGTFDQVNAVGGNTVTRPVTADDLRAQTAALTVVAQTSADNQAATTQAVAALAAVVIEIAQTGDPVVRQRLQEQVDALNRIANRGGSLVGTF